MTMDMTVRRVTEGQGSGISKIDIHRHMGTKERHMRE
jgi:hypothetical protein